MKKISLLILAVLTIQGNAFAGEKKQGKITMAEDFYKTCTEKELCYKTGRNDTCISSVTGTEYICNEDDDRHWLNKYIFLFGMPPMGDIR